MSLARRSLGQASVEYILMLSIIVLVAIGVKRALQPVLNQVSSSISRRIDSMFSQGNLHNLKLGR
jgi:hypothetical protein